MPGRRAKSRDVLGGVRVGLTLALTGAIVGEFVASNAGLGFLMLLARTNFEFYPRLDAITVYAIHIAAMTGKETPLPPLAEQWPAVDHTNTPSAVAPHEHS